MAEIPAHFERIERFWLAPPHKARIAGGVTAYGYQWNHSNFDWFKTLVNDRLRKRQKNRCCYCRRPLVFDKGHVEIDHIVHKGSTNSPYARFAFEAQNLALSCKDCNNNKGKKTVLARAIRAGSNYPKQAKAFSWVHPHFHRYSDHITIHQGWVYESKNKSPEGLEVIRKCMLDKLAGKELANRRVIVDGAADLKAAVIRAVAMVEDVGLERLCRELGGHLSRKWRSASSAEVKQVIRDTHAAVQMIRMP
ncbi:HNH endonuclease [Dyella sp. C11]|uniref:HNH endonuclease n=1 Tax=Dyella sp. C11 TaxID=2126991 RepID=UPI0013002E5F|nr:HNH endonuclease [Dyella sp. C11]